VIALGPEQVIGGKYLTHRVLCWRFRGCRLSKCGRGWPLRLRGLGSSVGVREPEHSKHHDYDAVWCGRRDGGDPGGADEVLAGRRPRTVRMRPRDKSSRGGREGPKTRFRTIQLCPKDFPAMLRQPEGAVTGCFRGRPHHERARRRGWAGLGFGHHRYRHRGWAVFGSVFSCDFSVPILSGLKPALD
jgi:hypothetical protein